jgi:hypothetical protein
VLQDSLLWLLLCPSYTLSGGGGGKFSGGTITVGVGGVTTTCGEGFDWEGFDSVLFSKRDTKGFLSNTLTKGFLSLSFSKTDMKSTNF